MLWLVLVKVLLPSFLTVLNPHNIHIITYIGIKEIGIPVKQLAYTAHYRSSETQSFQSINGETELVRIEDAGTYTTTTNVSCKGMKGIKSYWACKQRNPCEYGGSRAGGKRRLYSVAAGLTLPRLMSTVMPSRRRTM